MPQFVLHYFLSNVFFCLHSCYFDCHSFCLISNLFFTFLLVSSFFIRAHSCLARLSLLVYILYTYIHSYAPHSHIFGSWILALLFTLGTYLLRSPAVCNQVRNILCNNFFFVYNATNILIYS